MEIKNYLMINASNIVDNLCLWDGDTSKWTPPEGYTVLPQDETSAMIWKMLDGEYVLAEEMGAGQIGFTWNGIKFITNEPKPE
jgi:hypothetical protein